MFRRTTQIRAAALLAAASWLAAASSTENAAAQSPYGPLMGTSAPSPGYAPQATQSAATPVTAQLTSPAAVASISESIPSAIASPNGLPLLPRCVVKIVDEVNVSVEEAGLITSLEVREGMNVEADSVVGRVNDGRPRMDKLIAEASLHAAERKAQNEVEILHAEDVSKVAEYEYRASLVANERSPNAVAQVRLNELALAYQKAMRQIEVAKHNRELYRLEAEAKRVEVEAAEDEIRRRRIVAPISGQVTEVPVHVGQWVQPGDVVFRIVRLDRLSVDGLLSAADYAPSEIVHRPVVVETTLARGRRAQFMGKVTFVHPEIDNRGKFRIKAEIMNVAEADQYLLFPGKEVDMTIRLDVPADSAATPQYEIGRDPASDAQR